MRCPELGLLIDRASLRELQDIYPVLVNSIFGVNTGGGTGWGFRLMTRDTHPHDFDVLYNFFIPIGGPMFRLCYRLLSDSLKYELPVGMLPVSFRLGNLRERFMICDFLFSPKCSKCWRVAAIPRFTAILSISILLEDKSCRFR